MTADHANRAHAKLSASGSKRWLSCTPSAELEAQFEDSTSSFAEEGTAAHELSEIWLKYHLSQIKAWDHGELWKQAQKGKYYSREMEDYVQGYVSIVLERANEAFKRSKDAIVLLEQRLDFSEWVPHGFGTGDVLIIADGIMEVIDLKYGKGVPVSAEENSQMRLYGLGALDGYGYLYDIQTVRMTIVQPRLDSVSTEELTADDLLSWGEDYVKPRAAMAAAGEGEFAAGDHCRFCKARATCRTRAEDNLKLAKYEFRDGSLLSLDEVGDVLGRIDQLQKWAEDIKKHALDQAEKHGVRYPGWKLVEGRSNRIYSDRDAVQAALLAVGFVEDKILTPRELLGITAMEKAVGKKKFEELLSELIIKPTGKPTLAPEKDPRPELSSTASAAADFTDD
ncbi:DUF2800 domain-containing protein [Paenibacillus sp. URB8-2]|uniref:DUF2800 domain-containing protein n=1 Tax=Paenibacillus sp. URB8-2 TaxID=2741301 RepID=UPI0015BCC2B2|nr:DUF2800 domain-containing protein [Paenibacillus sp. URB8-2]BCG57461.1 hypothetical protein PUR_08860 [Paenibacillus sp. URB8-2]